MERSCFSNNTISDNSTNPDEGSGNEGSSDIKDNEDGGSGAGSQENIGNEGDAQSVNASDAAPAIKNELSPPQTQNDNISFY